jgi:hypothetical protein
MPATSTETDTLTAFLKETSGGSGHRLTKEFRS